MTLMQRCAWRERVVFFSQSNATLQRELENRNCSCEHQRDVAVRTLDDLALDRAHVLWYRKGKHFELRSQLELILARGLNHGVLPVILAEDIPSERELRHILKPFEFSERIKTYSIANVTDIAHIAEEIARYAPGPGPNEHLPIEGNIYKEEDKALIYRAFADCHSISIQRLSSGYSADVYSVHASLSQDFPGPRPLPFFVKLDKRDKIAKEISKYEDYVDGYIPFNQRPSLVKGRSCESCKRAIMVATFVDESEALWDVLQRGMGGTPIHSLFDRALRAWRLQAFLNPAYISTANNAIRPMLDSFMLDSIDPKKERDRFLCYTRIPKQQVELAASLGCTRSPKEMGKALTSLGNIPHRVGIIHGDLHSRNVRVHEGDAILIDFSRTCVGPISLDPAALEVDLVFGDFYHSEKWDTESAASFDPKHDWLQFVEKIYSSLYLRHPPPPAMLPDPREWLWNSIRQIRVFALADCVSDDEYMTALAIQLFHYGSFEGRDDGDKFRRAFALRMADRILAQI